jgi:hypothetical protein
MSITITDLLQDEVIYRVKKYLEDNNITKSNMCSREELILAIKQDIFDEYKMEDFVDGALDSLMDIFKIECIKVNNQEFWYQKD